ncbi:L-alanine-DL-glutamate epimerase-like enolase superfamily enzyme [Hoeflea marina]|uniref:L-alanine-DL-glutamate epimerase-like enolase superfamily enzyme n=1 Tax=Hoeflea marina TaxID=274592 RepID=A0A317PLE1_9HYPH|nr:mandelate racemase/muconate lactonizing enzyme family protein [Hoeflea marina]PWW00618.1 L-alanine-DL-glutamate epimerase-like enolase superfamily enzyme [Hoeflea marina]
MKIESITSRAYRLPLREAWISAKYRITHHELVRTDIVTESGLTGTGWCTTIGVGGLSIASLLTAYVNPLLVGEDCRNTERLWEAMWQDLHFAGPGGLTTLAIATVDIALWDLKAKAAGMPLWRLLGGARDRVDVYASAVNLHLTHAELMDQVDRHLAEGYGVFKIKIGRKDFEEDLERVRGVRARIGAARTLLLDSNQRWAAGDAVRFCRALEDVRPGWIEEPILSDDIAGHAQLRGRSGIPVAVGEQLCNRFEFWNYVRAGAADVLQPNVGKVGGITEWMKIAHMAQHANLVVAPHNALELSAHLVAAVPNGFMVENIEGGNLADFGIVSQAPGIENAQVVLGEAPGHGVVFDEAALARFAMDPLAVVNRQSSMHAGI